MPGVKRRRRLHIAVMPTVWVGLSVKTGSNPIEGSLDTGQPEPQRFCGWVELAAAIEAVRAAQAHEPDPRAKPTKD
jgi:hypothetical protein